MAPTAMASGSLNRAPPQALDSEEQPPMLQACLCGLGQWTQWGKQLPQEEV